MYSVCAVDNEVFPSPDSDMDWSLLGFFQSVARFFIYCFLCFLFISCTLNVSLPPPSSPTDLLPSTDSE